MDKLENTIDKVKKILNVKNNIQPRIVIISAVSIITIIFVVISIIICTNNGISDNSVKAEDENLLDMIQNNNLPDEPVATANSYNKEVNKILGDKQYSDEELEKYKREPIVDTSKIYTYDDMVNDLSILYSLYYKNFTIKDHGKTADGRTLYEAIVGNPNASKHVLIHAGIHAREYITSTLAMKQLEYYLKMYNERYDDTSFADIFNNVAFHIVPMVNPDGITISQSGTSKIKSQKIKDNLVTYYNRDYAAQKIYTDFDGYLKIWKSNAIGTDINKNFNNDWAGYDGPKVPSRLNYKGSAVESEPETKALVNIVKSYNFVGAIAYHATGSVIYWDFNQQGTLRNKCYELASCVNNVTGYTIYSSNDIQLSQAGFSDWMVVVNQIPSLTVEVGRGTAPLPVEDFDHIWDDNSKLWGELGILYK